MTQLELLAPAKTADIGIEAIRHGADAVYIGAPKFGARLAAGNSIDDIHRLVDYAHQFAARVYVTINTILDDDELEEARQLIWNLYDIGVDALIVQDVGLLRLSLPPIPLHASTQMDNRTPERVRELQQYGFSQVVLARELSIEEIRHIHEVCPDMPLEFFVHGALCVSFSGQCYASECLLGRSANRGACAQVCRMEFDLIRTHRQGGKETEQTVVHKKHLLSLKDLCLIDALPQLVDAGVTSFKIEGRLKDLSYVKNVTAAYHQALNRIVQSAPDRYERASRGVVELKFQPDVSKSFNRGFTSYFLFGRTDRIFSFDTPKAMGEDVGIVKEIFHNCFSVAGLHAFANGDGLCFIDRQGKLFGFRLNKVANGLLYPLEMPRNLMPKMHLYRNFDKRFEDTLQRESAHRTIPVDITIDETSDGFMFRMTDDYFLDRQLKVACEHQLARTHQTDNIRRQLSKMGDTVFRLRDLKLNYSYNWFIPSSMLSEWRRQLTAPETDLIVRTAKRPEIESDMSADTSISSVSHSCSPLTYLANIMNHEAKAFCEGQGYRVTEWAYEKEHQMDVPVMYCKHCLRYSLGWCHKHPNANLHSFNPSTETLYLQLANGRRFRLDFDCKECVMKLI